MDFCSIGQLSPIVQPALCEQGEEATHGDAGGGTSGGGRNPGSSSGCHPRAPRAAKADEGGPTRILRRGAHAWGHAAHDDDTPWEQRVPRLLVHAAMDDTVKVYIKEFREALLWIQKEGIPVFPGYHLDAGLAQYIDFLCFRDGRGISAGKTAISGCMHVYPSLRLPEAFRALKSWDKLAPGKEGHGVALELLLVMADRMDKKGADGIEAADALRLSIDGYLREQDWEGLRPEDIEVAPDGSVALIFGQVKRGERSKTGHDQGILLDYPSVRKMMKKRKLETATGAKIFNINQRTYRRIWYEVAGDLNVLELVGRPHNVRHSAPSHDVFHQYRRLLGVQRRGRWRVDSSVLRYAKTHFYAKALAGTPESFLEEGGGLLTGLGTRATVPVA